MVLKLDTLESRSEIPEKFRNLVLEKDGEISWTNHVRNEEVLRGVMEDRNIVHTIKRRKANWIGHILRRNCLLKHIIEEKMEGGIEETGRRGRRRKQLLGYLTET